MRDVEGQPRESLVDTFIEWVTGVDVPPVSRQDSVLERLPLDLASLRVSSELSGRLRVALRRRRELRRIRRGAVFATRTGIFVMLLMAFFFVLAASSPEQAAQGTAREHNQGIPPILVGAVAVTGLFYGVLVLLGQVGWRTIRLGLRYTLVMQIAAAISACAAARRAGGERSAKQLRLVSKRLERVSRGVERSHRTRGTVRGSHRRQALKAHQRQVVAALRMTERRLDSAPEEGLHELAELLVGIAERYAHGRIGELLDAEIIKDINPERDRGLLRWIAAVVLGTAATVGITLLNLPSSIEGPIIGGSIVLVVGIISGPSTRHALDVVGTIRGSGAP
ncbi:hypothetical protein FBY37_0023 [Streptomyces sp. SLBN-134]|nr:hypothetical protein FBY37_0023 [Streptomyces sp. SLBN-134]